ncbi:hypothetical protein [Roseibium suaedae]|uniref:2-keto-4-pentenoate hydratase n=1 Tax=Roseibium suaedae TaxID=735517 RepID=A0A1M7BTZ4_9HYPH|nr:hypothetical protein [Roseibium suaedae]SHL58336.1 2-keto-4-pentenoate hydratase [Roseibium suaedae]
MHLEEAISLLVEARKSGKTLDRLPESCRPQTNAEAYRIQKEVADRLGLTVTAWKTAAAGPTGPVAAPIFAGTVHNAPLRLKAAALETEIALRVSKDLPSRPDAPYSREEILAHVDAMAMAFELVDWRLTSADLSPTEKAADYFANAGLVIGTPIPIEGDISSPLADITLTCNGVAEPYVPNEIDPVESLRAYASTGGDQFGGLKAGQWVTTGSMTGVQRSPAAGKWHANWKGLTAVDLEIEG